MGSIGTGAIGLNVHSMALAEKLSSSHYKENLLDFLTPLLEMKNVSELSPKITLDTPYQRALYAHKGDYPLRARN